MLRISALALVAAASLPALATTTVTDYEDIWYNESQSGWGVNIAQQGEVLFATLFVYGSDNTPRWYVATLQGAGDNVTFRGDLVSVGSGTYFAAPWTGVANVQTVGTMAFAFDSASTGTLTYVVNGTTVTKSIVRQSWRSDVLSGTYMGGVTGFGSTCGATGRVRVPGALVVTHTAPTIAMTLTFNVAPNSGVCSYQGTYSQAGSMGSIREGAYHCDVNGVANAVTGNFTVDEIRATRNGWIGRITVVSPQCNYAGYIGGVKDSF
ncbi:MAG TPA: hypothetical protein VLJ84_11285 [Usitatibacter sp.]|nr:hypothetical protein [Usitatibacter sp.]